MTYKHNPIIERMKNHSSIGMDKNIRIIKKKLSFVKLRKINIEINSFHKDIINKYKSINDIFFYDDFNFLHYTAPEESSLRLKKDVDEKVQEQIKIVLEKVYVEQEKVVQDFRVKELLLQKAKLIEYEKNIVNERFIKEILYKEINRFRKSDSTELDERILFYTQVNNYLKESKTTHITKNYHFNSKKLIEYNTKEVKSFIELFKENEEIKGSKDSKDINALKKIEKNIIKSLSIEASKKIEKPRKKQTSIRQALNINNLFGKNKRDASIFNDLSFENNTNKLSQTLFNSLESKQTKDLKSSELVKISKEVISTFGVQIKKLFQVESSTVDINSSFEEDIKAVLANPTYSNDRINEELSLIKKSYVNTVLINEEKDLDIRDIKDEKSFENNIYKQSIIQLAYSQVIVNATNKKTLNNVIKNILDHKENFTSVNAIINEVLIKFQQTNTQVQHPSIYNLSSNITQKYVSENLVNVNKFDVKANPYKLKTKQEVITNFKSESYLQNIINTVMHVEKTPSTSMINTTVQNNITKNIFESKVENIYKNILEEIKINRPYKQLSVIDKKVVLEQVNKLVHMKSETAIKTQYEKIRNTYITQSENNTTVQNILNTTLQNSIIDNTVEQNILNTTLQNNITKNIFESKVENIYKNILEEIKINRPYKQLSVIDKKVVLEQVNKLVHMKSETAIKTQYEKIRNTYITQSENNTTVQNILNTTLQNSIIDNTVEQNILNTTLQNNITKNIFESKVENIYKNILEEIKINRPYKQLSVIDKKVVLEQVNKLVHMKSETAIKTQYEKIKNEYIRSSLIEDEFERVVSKKAIYDKFHQDKLVSIDFDDNIEVFNPENGNVVLGNSSKINTTKESRKMVYIGNPEALNKHEKNKIEAHNKSIDLEIKHKKFEITNNIQNVYEDLDENLDELALKIFNDLRDEINIEYKRI